MKVYIFEIWDEAHTDCYHECGFIESISDAAYDTREKAQAAAEREIRRYSEQCDVDDLTYVIKGLEIK